MAEDYIKMAEDYVNQYTQNPGLLSDVNYNDSRLTDIKNEQAQKENEMTNEYNQMINSSDKFYNEQIQASKDYAKQQQDLQNQKMQQAIDVINQNKDKTQKDYIKEQKGAYADYQKQIDPYSVNAENLASNGLSNSGYSETSKVSMYNTYQNRIATARESLNTAILNYDNAIKEAQLTNNTTLAEIAAEALKNQQELALQGFQYKNTLIQTKQQQLQELGTRYDNKYQNMLSQINNELSSKRDLFNTLSGLLTQRKQLEENIRQANAEMAYKREQLAYQKQRDAIADQQWQKEYNAKYGTSGSNSLTVSNSGSNKKLNVNMVLNAAKNLVNIANNSKSLSNRISAKASIDQCRNYTIQAYNLGKISREDANKIFDIIG